MNLQLSMNYKKQVLKKIKLILLRIQLWFLESKRNRLVEEFMCQNFSQASKVDDIEKLILTDEFLNTVRKVKIVNKKIKNQVKVQI